MSEREIVGHVDELGYVWCVHCKQLAVDELDESGYPAPIYIDAPPHNTDSCDGCNTPLTHPVTIEATTYGWEVVCEFCGPVYATGRRNLANAVAYEHRVAA